MRINYGFFIFIFLLALSIETRAQLRCTNCTVGTTTATPVTILELPGTYTGGIVLTGNSEFEITGTGNYVIDGVISETPGQSFGVTYKAPGAGAEGNGAGITLTGAANTYSGLTTIAGGYLICNKPSGGAVPGSLKISALSADVKVHLWCKRDNQLKSTAIVDFNGAQSDSYLHLNGTIQTIAGLRADNANALVENQRDFLLPDGMTVEQLINTREAILNIAVAAGSSCSFGGGNGGRLQIQKGSTNSPPLTLKVTTGTQIIYPDYSVANVTLLSEAGATLEFNGRERSNPYYLSTSGVILKGNGTIKKSGPKNVQLLRCTILKPAGEIWVSEGTLENSSYSWYTNNNTINKATLRIDAPTAGNHNPAFDLQGNTAIFDGLIGGGLVYNDQYSEALPEGGGYSWLILGQNNSQGAPVFEGVIKDNPENDAVITGGHDGGVALKKVGTGTQVLKGVNRYTGSTTVSSGTLKLWGDGLLGATTTGGTYGGVLEISNVSAGTESAIFEHSGVQTQIFTGNITNTGTGTFLGTYFQSGSGKSIINSFNNFNGNVNITAGFLGGSGSLSNANRVTVGAGGSIGGGNGEIAGGPVRDVLAVSNLTFSAATSKLRVTVRQGSYTPSLLEVMERGYSLYGSITVADNNIFTVDILGASYREGYILRCVNGLSPNPPVPVVGINDTGKLVSFKWDNIGLYISIGELTCDKCTFKGPDGITDVVGTPESPAVIGPPGTFAGNITLNGPCNFTITGTGNYTLSGIISGTGPLTYNAPDAPPYNYHLLNTGITLSGSSNTYTGLTTIAGGYVICNKEGTAVPGNLNLSSANGGCAHLWCQNNNQLAASAIIDFRTPNFSAVHLNGTTQTIAGLIAHNDQFNDRGEAVVDNYDFTFPVGIPSGWIRSTAGTLNIEAGVNHHVFRGGAIGTGRERGTNVITVNIKSGTQAIEDCTGETGNLIVTTSAGTTTSPPGTLELSGGYLLGNNITFKGNGIIKKTREVQQWSGLLQMGNNTTVIKSGGLIWVHSGTWQSGSNTRYATNDSSEINRATLQVGDLPPSDDPYGPIFDLYGNSSIFDGLTGSGYVENSFYSMNGTEGHNLLTLGQNDSQGDPIFNGTIRDRMGVWAFGSTPAGSYGVYRISLRKVGIGTQVLGGRNHYSGSTTVSSGTLKLQGNGLLGVSENPADNNIYLGVLEISNVTATDRRTPAIFEHNGNRTQIFNGNIINTGNGTLGTYLQSGTGKTIIEGTKSFTGNVNITGGFLGGSGDLRKANSVTVGRWGSIGGGRAEDAKGGTLTVANLTFAEVTSKLIVTSISATDNTPSLVEVKTMASEPRSITAANNFTVDIVAGSNLLSGYILKCSNGLSSTPPVAILGTNNNTGKPVTFKWDSIGLYMSVWGLTCNNCTFTRADNTPEVVGTPESPAVILSSGTFDRPITLTGNADTPCTFTTYGTGNYTLSGQITGTGPLIYNAPDASPYNLNTGITLSGSSSIDYTGLTTIAGGYVICNKEGTAVPGNLNLSSANGGCAHLWCQNNDQLAASAIIDFRTPNFSAVHLNGTTQTIAGLIAHNNQFNDRGKAVVDNYGYTFPVGIPPGWIRSTAGTLNIEAGVNRHVFRGGAIGTGRERGTNVITVNIKSGTQAIEDCTTETNNLILTTLAGTTTSPPGTLEFSGGYLLGNNITFKGNGIIKKTREVQQWSGLLQMGNNTTVIKSGGLIWVHGGTWQSGSNTRYATNDSSEINRATLQVGDLPPSDDPYGPIFDLYGNSSIFDGLTGSGYVENSFYSMNGTEGHNLLTLGQNDSQGDPIFNGTIRDRMGVWAFGSTPAGSYGVYRISLRKVGIGTQVLGGRNHYSGSTTVSSGTLKLQGNGLLGVSENPADNNIYLGVLEISNVTATDRRTPAIFEHNGEQTQIFTGNITNTGTGTLGTCLQSGTGKTIIEGTKSFTGNVNITGGFLGGSGDLRNASSVTVGRWGSIGGGHGVVAKGNTLTVSDLTFEAADSKLIVTSISATDNTPSLVKVKRRGTSDPGSITAANNFTVDIVAGSNLVSGYILKCSNGIGSPLPTLGTTNNTGRPVSLRWDGVGLYMSVWGLTCNNCTFTRSDNTPEVVGTPEYPAAILSSPGTFDRPITLTGNADTPCTFTTYGTGNYTLSGQITGDSPLIYNAPDANQYGFDTGIILSGSSSNDYTGLTTITGGYVICNKEGTKAVPGNLKISATSAARWAHLWCQRDNQLAAGATIDFSNALSNSIIHLNGTTQTAAGLIANNDKAVVKKNYGRSRPGYYPAGIPLEQISRSAGTLNIEAGAGRYVFGGGGYILTGEEIWTGPEIADNQRLLTVNIKSGTQVIENPGASRINNLILRSSVNPTTSSQAPATLELSTGSHGPYSPGANITLEGDGIIKKTGEGRLEMSSNTTVIKSGGLIWVHGGTWQNAPNTRYATNDSTNVNTATLQVPDTPISNGNHNGFDLNGSASIFDGLTGNAYVYNDWVSPNRITPAERRYCLLTLGQNNSQGNPNPPTHIFNGSIQDNSTSGSINHVPPGSSGRAGISLRKVGTGTQVLSGVNRYTGSTTVSSGILRLQEDGRLGRAYAVQADDNIYGGVLEISNVTATDRRTPAIFEHNGDQTQIFTGNITNTNTGTGTLGTYLQSGNGKTIIEGETKSFTGNVNITAGFLGGSGDLRNANSVTVGRRGSIGGGDGETDGGATLTVANLTFVTTSSKLIVTSISGTNTPSLVEVKTRASEPGLITVASNFTVEIVAGPDLVSGYILKCSNGAGLSPPDRGFNNTGRLLSFRWDGIGLYMSVWGLTCDNCTFTRADNTPEVAGIPGNPAVILGSPGTFDRPITLTGNADRPCTFTITGTGNYTLSGQITGDSPLIYNAPDANQYGFNTGITLSGNSSNNYTGTTTIAGGYVVCNKEETKAAVPPGNLKISATSAARWAHLWCQRNNQLAAGVTIDFSNALSNSIIHLNGTTQTAAGLIANNDKAVVRTNYGPNRDRSPAGIPLDQISGGGGTLNIEAGPDRYVFGEGGSILTGEGVAPNERLLTINIKSGTQVIENPGASRINNLILKSSSPATLELSGSSYGPYSPGANITLEGDGIIKKTGQEQWRIEMNDNTTVIKSGGLIWVSGGVLRNGPNTRYATNNSTNRATLQVDAPPMGYIAGPTFDLYGSASIFDGLTGGGYVQNGWVSPNETTPPEKVYCLLTLGQNNSLRDSIFDGIIRDNSSSGSTSHVLPGRYGWAGISLRKVGTGTQVLRGLNRYTGSTTVSSGILRLQGNGRLGGASAAPADNNTYGSVLEISNVPQGRTSAIFEHNGDRTQIFTGNITNTGTNTGTLGTYLQSGRGKTIIEGETKSFTGNVNITAGFLGGSGDLHNANSVTVGRGGSIGGGYDEVARGGTLIVANLTFAEVTSKLIVTSISATNNTPSLVEVKTGGGSDSGLITVANNRFTVDVVGGNRLVNGYILKCSNGLSPNPPVPVLGINNTERPVFFKWDNIGLYMSIWGLTCNNCTFTRPDNPNVVGTPEAPAAILDSPGTFEGPIRLTGNAETPCTFTIYGTGNYTLSGQITGDSPLIYKASNAAFNGFDAGITLSGNSSNIYTGLTTIAGGYVICNKEGAKAVPGNLNISATSTASYAHLWCQRDNQLAAGATIDFSNALSNSIIHLNGTTQTAAGLIANNDKAVVKKNYGRSISGYYPAGIPLEQISRSAGTLNIEAGVGHYVFGGGGYILTGEEIWTGPEIADNQKLLTVNIKSGTQVIENPGASRVNNLILKSSSPATLELSTGHQGPYSLGSNITLEGNGIIKKTGEGPRRLEMSSNTTVIKSGGLIWVHGGTWQNAPNTRYATNDSTNVNTATLQVPDTPISNGNHNGFDLNGSASIFDGLTGNAYVYNDWVSPNRITPAERRYCLLTLGQNNSQGNPNPPTHIFNGSIQDNSTSGSINHVPPGSSGRAGISLRKVGTGTQVLRGVNRYTGSTTVSSGILKLQEDGRLGRAYAVQADDNIYGGVLEISNVTATDRRTPAIFEHDGDQTQIFTGNITNTGTGTLGTYLQSGNGKTIIEGETKSFTGNVNITGGFLGGSGDLRNANSVTVGRRGSIGGGYDEAARGGTLIVANLTFAAEASKLIVTSTSETNTPSLVEVKAGGGSDSGSITAAHSFTVDIVDGSNLVSGYILKCSNGIGRPLPTLGTNNTGKMPCFRWDAAGLWMHLNFGNINLASSFCPKGGNPGNPDITITATYTDSRGYITEIGEFSLSDTSVKSGDIVTIRVDNATVTATFAGVNITDANRLYTVTYKDHRNCTASLPTRINPQPTLSITSGGNPYCKGTPIVLQATGNAGLTIASSNTDIATVANNTPPDGTATATTLLAGDVNFRVTDGDGCRSEYLPVLVKDIPVMETVVQGNLLPLCKGQLQLSIPLRSNGTGVTKADAYKWERHGGNNIYDVGLADHNTSPPTETAIYEFTARNDESTTQRRDVRVTPYNNQTGCYGDSKDFTIQVAPVTPAIGPESRRICANNGGDTSNSIELTATDVPATTNPWTIVSGSEYGSIADGDVTDRKANVSALDAAGQTEEKTVTVQFTSIHGCKAAATVTISPKTRLDYMRASKLCQHSDLNENVSIEVKYSNSHGYALNETTGSWKLINTATPATAENLAVSTSKATSTTNIMATFPGVAGTSRVRYVDSSTGCAADKSVMITIEAFTAPEVTTPVLLCQNSQAFPLAVIDAQGTYKWWSPGTTQPGTNAPTPLTTFVAEVEYKVSKVKNYNGTEASTGTTPLAYSCTGPQATIRVTVGTSVSISSKTGIDLTKLCSGTTIDDFILTNSSGIWLITDQASNAIGTTITTNTTGNGNLRAGTVDSDNSVVQDIRFKSGNCLSNAIAVTINPKPTVNISNLNLCANAQQARITPLSGRNLRGATGYKWEQSGADRGEVGVADNTDEWLSSIPAFTTPATDVVLTRSLSITPYNSNTTCTGETHAWTITVNLSPTVEAPADREHCSGVAVEATALRATRGPNTFTWTGGARAGLANGTGLNLPKYWASAATAPVGPLTVTITARSSSNSSGCTGSAVFHITVNPRPSIRGFENVQNLCTGPAIETAVQTNIGVTTSVAGTKYTWSATLIDYTPDARSRVKIINGGEELSFPTPEFTEEGDFIKKIIANVSAEAQITLYLKPSSGSCVGAPMQTSFRVNGISLMSNISNNSPEVCSGETTDIKIGDKGDRNTYTWKEINNSSQVLGLTPPESSSEATAIRDVLTVAKKRGSTTYYITTGRRIINQRHGDYDCVGASVSHTVVVNPIPVLSLSPDTASVCSGDLTAIAYSIDLEHPESNSVYYSWEVSPNKVGAKSSSGLQKDMPKQPLTNSSDLEESVTHTIIPWYKSETGKNCAGQPGTFTHRVAPGVLATISSTTPEPVCLGDKITLKANTKANGKVTYQWLLNGKDKQPIPGATEDSYDVPTDKESEASYRVTVTTGNCGGTASEPKTVRVSADAYFTGGSVSIDKATALMGEAVKFSYTGPIADHLWNFNDNTPAAPNTSSVTHSYIKPGTYYPTLKVTKPNQEECTKTFSLPLEIGDIDPRTGFAVFPIPTRDKITIKNNNDLQKITLFSMSGRTILSEVVKGRTATLSLANMAQGVYLLSITDSESVKHVKVCKE